MYKIDHNNLCEQIKIAKKNCLNELPDFLVEEVVDNGFLAGGCFSSFVRGEEPKDFDIFLKTVKKDTLKQLEFLLREVLDNDSVRVSEGLLKNNLGTKITIADGGKHYLHGGSVDLSLKTDRIDRYSQGALTFGKTQLVLCHLGEPDQVFEKFDMQHCKFYSEFSSDEVFYPSEAKESVESNLIKLHSMSHPLRTLNRVFKLSKRGWRIYGEELFELKHFLQEVDFSSQMSFIREMAGAYDD